MNAQRGKAALAFTAALGAACAIAPGCRCRDASSPLVQDFEGITGLGKWPKDAAGVVERSSDWKADGEESLRIDPGLLATISSLKRTDFRGFDALRIEVHNTSASLAVIGFELSDANDTLYDRHRRSFGVPPGDSTIDLDLSGDLWRGEENRPFRGPTKTPLDLRSITRIGLENRGDRTVYVDALTLVRDPVPVPSGAFAFDFGKRGSRVMGKTTGVFEDTAYDAAQGFGFVSGKRSFLGNSMSYPTPLLGDGLAWEDSVFRVDLEGGPHVLWIAFERGGFWEAEGEATGYSGATLFLNGKELTSHAFSPAGPHFFFEDVEVTRVEDAWAKLILPAHGIQRFTFEAKRGENQFRLEVHDLRGPPLRVAGLFVAPDTDEGRRFIDAQEARQKRAFESAYPPSDHARRPAGAALPAKPLVAEVRPTGEVAHPRDLPESGAAAGFASPAIVTAVSGHKAYLQLALYAKDDLDITVAASSGSASTRVPAPRFSYAVYGPKRTYEGGTAWIEAEYFRPLGAEETLRVGPDLARSVLVEFEVPKDAPTGRADFSVQISAAKNKLLELPISVDVRAMDLPPLPVPVGLFMSALPFAPDAVGAERWWALQEELLRIEGEGGLNTSTGGPGLGYSMSPAADGYAFSGDDAFRYLEKAHAFGMDKAVVCYSGFLPSIKHERPDAARFQKSWLEVETARHLPPHYLYSYDEPSTDDELRAVASYLGPFRDAGVRTIGFFSHVEGDRYQPVLDGTHAIAVSGHTAAQIEEWVKAGRHVFLYNRGVGRLSAGADLFRAIKMGVAGRLEWIGVYTQGFAFDDLDGREPSYGMFVVHDKLGILPTPRWLSLREGLLDARVRLALESAKSSAVAAPVDWPEGYPASPDKWPDTALEAARVAALKQLTNGPAPR